MRKCFEGIYELNFTEFLEIVGMRSQEKEELLFDKKLIPSNYHGNIENLLIDVEELMRTCVMSYMEKSINDYTNTPKRSNWVLKWPSQIVLCVSQIFFCQYVTEALSTGSLYQLE